MYFTACMMNVTYQEGDCIYNERKKEDFDEGADSEAARRVGDAADPIFIRHGQGRPRYLAYSALPRLAFPILSSLSRYACLKKETKQTISKVDVLLRFSRLLLFDDLGLS